jgi:hypothetical protein
VRTRIGFVILSHNRPGQLLALVQRLVTLYDGAPIVCHHDFSQCRLEGYQFPEQVEFVQPHIRTEWGQISLVNAFRAGLRRLYERPDSPDWFVLLSGADYPVRSPELVLNELSESPFDAYLDHRLVEYPYTPDLEALKVRYAFHSARWVPMAYDRYVAIKLWVPWFSWTRKRPVKVPFATVRSGALVRRFRPFSAAFRCWGGDMWFTANRKCAERLLADTGSNRRVLAHFSKCLIPDETVAHTILCNHPDLRISKDNKRYANWTQGGYHPKTLGVLDIQAILESGAHFARKFDRDRGPRVFHELDRIVALQTSALARQR